MRPHVWDPLRDFIHTYKYKEIIILLYTIISDQEI